MPVVITNTGTAPADEVELTGSAPSGWKITFEPKIDRAHRAERQQGSAGADHADREGDRRRLRDDGARLGARRIRLRHLPGHGDDLDHVGHCRRRHHRRGAPGHGRRGREVRPAMSGDIVIEAQGLTKTYGRAIAVDHISFSVERGEDVRAPRAQRRGQDDHHPDAARIDRNLRRRGARARLQSGARAALGQAPRRLSARHGRLLRSAHRRRQSALHRAADRLSARRAREEDRGRARPGRALGLRRQSASAPSRAACVSGSGSPRSS